MADERIMAALDIGTSKIVALVAEADENDDVYVIGHGVAAAEGLRRGVVVDMEHTVKSIRKAIEDAQMVSGTEIDRVTVGVAGEHIHSINSHGVIAIGRSDAEITEAEVDRVMEAARTVAIPVDREIVHVIPQSFSVDEQTGIKDPVGMSGVRLEVEAHIVTASVTSARNIYRALERCALEIDNMVLESLALSNALLTEDDTESGVIQVDVGAETTSLAVFYDGAIRHTAVVSLGGRNVTNDIAIGLRCSVEQAEDFKTSHGAALASTVDPEEMISVSGVAGRPAREISRHVLASIIEPRMEEIFSLVGREVKKVGRTDNFTAGVVLSGGGALLPGTVELAEQMFDMPVRVGSLRNISHVPEDLQSLRFATAHGLAAYAFAHDPAEMRRGGPMRGFFKKLENWITRQF